MEKLESEMRHQFEVTRAKCEHSGNKGANAETILRNFLREYLPRRYGIGHGEIIDTQGRRSAQTDIVIVTDEHPFTFIADQVGFFFIEGVFATGEVKSVLTSQELDIALINASKFRELKCDARGMTMLWSLNDSDHKRFVNNPPYFLFAFETQVAKETVRQSLMRQTKRSIDAVFILNQGAILDFGDGNGSLQYMKADGTKLLGWNCISDSNTLSHLLLWLSVMPEVHHGEGISSRYLLDVLKRSHSVEQSLSLKEWEDPNKSFSSFHLLIVRSPTKRGL